MLNTKELNIINQTLAKGYDVMIKAKKDEIVIMEQKPKIVGRTEKTDNSDKQTTI